MRKATIIFILVAFVGSIMIVNFFGLKPKVYNEYLYVEEISIVEENIKCSPGIKMTDFNVDSKNVITIKVDYDQGYKDRTGKEQFIMIIPHCLPDNANDKKVEATCSEKLKEFYICDNENPYPIIKYNYTEEKMYEINNKKTLPSIELSTFYLSNAKANDKTTRTIKIITHLVDLIEE